MTTKTVDAVYEDGILRLAETIDIAARSHVRVRIEIPSSGEATGSHLEERRRALPPDKRELLDRVRGLRDRTPRVGFNIVEALREMREHG